MRKPMIKTSRKSVWMIAKVHNPSIDFCQNRLSIFPKTILDFFNIMVGGSEKTQEDSCDVHQLQNAWERENFLRFMSIGLGNSSKASLMNSQEDLFGLIKSET
ncbi:MAG TPA: hypothetical protein VE954_25840 [Oligoflexus sp.]|uniref:hypothetical protein n=1 Tax=Oligoflexus sp. TaxID=1971216 RepID=UPI002D30DBE2|nr:hypothetical protein [Oligoflexus sp.]HYX36545.1 hypothetical protein [Oligoflexus sp.]